MSLHQIMLSVALLTEIRSKTSQSFPPLSLLFSSLFFLPAQTESQSTHPPEGKTQDNSNTRILTFQWLNRRWIEKKEEEEGKGDGNLLMTLRTFFQIFDCLLTIQLQTENIYLLWSVTSTISLPLSLFLHLLDLFLLINHSRRVTRRPINQRMRIQNNQKKEKNQHYW